MKFIFGLPFIICSIVSPIVSNVAYAQTFTAVNEINVDYDNPKLKAAGVLPYALADDGKIYVLLGRQTVSKIPSSGMWKGFGGKRDPGETLVLTALREAKEESRAVLGENSPIYCPCSFPFSEAIVTEHYNFKYLQLMAPVAWDATISERFQKIYSEDSHIMEKLDIKWVAFEDLYKSIEEAHQASIEEKCLPSQIKRIIHVKTDNDFLPLARDFVETLTANYRNPQDSIHLLSQNQMPISYSFSTDLDLVTIP
jgi:8-oxo-dGTP pyrophosphatase MutT (NUDIX family)